MVGYTLKNLRDDVEDMAPKFGMGPPLEARFAREPLGCEKSATGMGDAQMIQDWWTG